MIVKDVNKTLAGKYTRHINMVSFFLYSVNYFIQCFSFAIKTNGRLRFPHADNQTYSLI
jgi:hypothetical protein